MCIDEFEPDGVHAQEDVLRLSSQGLKESSGYSRLAGAALDAARNWR
jgi:hypothetical protein